MEGTTEITEFKEYLKASNADGIHILEATAPWCSQCKAIAPFIEKLTKKYPEANWYYYNTDTALQIAQELGANQMPTFHFFKDGDLKDSVTGASGKKIEDALKSIYDGEPQE